MLLKTNRKDGIKTVILHSVLLCISEITTFTCQTLPKDGKQRIKGKIGLQSRVVQTLQVFLKNKTLFLANYHFQTSKNALSEATVKPPHQVHYLILLCYISPQLH
jgi:hypothetical protein